MAISPSVLKVSAGRKRRWLSGFSPLFVDEFPIACRLRRAAGSVAMRGNLPVRYFETAHDRATPA